MARNALRDSNPIPAWARREGWRPFGDRLGFLSPERAHMMTGRLSIMPPRDPSKRR